MKRVFSLRSKLILANFLVVMAVHLMTAIFWGYKLYQDQNRYFISRIDSQAEVVSNTMQAALLFNDVEAINEALQSLRSDRNILFAAVYDADNNLLTTQTFGVELNPQPGIFRAVFGKFADAHVVEVNELMEDGTTPLGRLRVRAFDFGIDERMGELARAMVFVGSLCVLMSVLIGFVVNTRLIDPLRRLSILVRRVIATRDYSLRSNLQQGDEVGQLAADFNEMLELVESRDQGLLATVRERSAELEAQGEALITQAEITVKAKQAQRAIRERFEHIFMHSPMAAAMITEDRYIFRYNAAFEKLLAIRAGEKPHLSLDAFIGQASMPDFMQAVQRLQDDKQTSFEIRVDCVNNEGEIINAVVAMSCLEDYVDNTDYAIVQILDVTESHRLSKELEYHANHDVLTGLPNRRYLREVLQDSVQDLAANPGVSHTLCFLDLDQFKLVNDTCGHIAGDELLQQISRVIPGLVRPGDLVARLGGDEFALLLYNATSSEVQEILESIRRAIEDFHFVWELNSFRIGVSIGAVSFDQPATDILTLMKHADAACYSAKEQGRNRVLHVGIDDPRMNARQGELQWVHRIQQAIENDNFVLFGQDIIPLDAAEERPRKEVLLRLAAPDEPEGYILPGAFLPAAERYGLGARLDAWVVSQLLSRLGDLTSAQANACSYWINLSGATFSDDKFFEFLERALATVDLLPGTINFEITETDVIRNLPEASAQIEKLNRLGCRFAMDDFGSGISSFGYLKNLPVDYIKIDGMFVRDIVNDEIDLIFVKSIIDIAKAMNLKTVAEYVCDERVLAKIRELGADYAQGYEISKPQPLFPA